MLLKDGILEIEPRKIFRVLSKVPRLEPVNLRTTKGISMSLKPVIPVWLGGLHELRNTQKIPEKFPEHQEYYSGE